MIGGPSLFIHSAWNNPPGTVRRLFILGAGFSKHADGTMPIASELTPCVLDATGLRSLPASTLESALAYLAEEHPFDRAEEPHRRRFMLVQAIRAIADYVAERQDRALDAGRPR